jgi:hypothetical protein
MSHSDKKRPHEDEYEELYANIGEHINSNEPSREKVDKDLARIYKIGVNSNEANKRREIAFHANEVDSEGNKYGVAGLKSRKRSKIIHKGGKKSRRNRKTNKKRSNKKKSRRSRK